MQKYQSTEDYLETILILKNKLGTVRAIDIAKAMNFSKPSVSIAMKNLRAKGFIQTDGDGFIQLTADGLALAERTYEKHNLLIELLLYMGVSEQVAKTDACLIEHVISSETFEKLKEFHTKNQLSSK